MNNECSLYIWKFKFIYFNQYGIINLKIRKTEIESLYQANTSLMPEEALGRVNSIVERR
ncbi:MAG: hypothetical protein K0S01_422 [Herbinix sp.]|jgi:hypothetical protein|nr:hypothetical protein [Herbinix sp.]